MAAVSEERTLGLRITTTGWITILVVVAIGIVTAWAVIGTNFVLDDWYTLRNAHFGGPLDAAGTEQRAARPGAWLTYAVIFGLVGRNPLPVLLIQGAIVLPTALVLFATIRRFLPEWLAGLAALLWLVFPNHISLEVWASASNIALALLLLVVGAFLLSSPELSSGRAAVAALLLAASMLSYEATALVGAASAIALPWIVQRRIRWDVIALVGAAMAAAALWIVTHWHPAKSAQHDADLTQVVGAHFGWGIVPDGLVAELFSLIAVVGIGVAMARLAMSSTRSRTGAAEWAVLGGLVILVLGTAPFAFYFYAPLGAGDRFNVVSAVGGALIWAGFVGMLQRVDGRLALGAVVLMVVPAVLARGERAVLWHRAGHDAVAILDGVQRQIPDPDGTIVIGPAPIQQDNVAAFLDQSNIDAALQLVYDDSEVRGGLSFSQEQFESVPPSLRFDIRPVSELEPDTVVEAG